MQPSLGGGEDGKTKRGDGDEIADFGFGIRNEEILRFYAQSQYSIN
ncbi:MAG: hypothetical protein HY730_08785 [Candidatus Tectomicrobia bacterium]|uniref:Uncharacterized protein n=1 Tax=Tectimicrobiota bacterium TaxID=2528274 RepID=A0A933GPG5_UNCTE|nr:hypothetical protein [Candidatus Tectomicrobia bacterium]